jgi:AmiR/NasT family two-component response regulator
MELDNPERNFDGAMLNAEEADVSAYAVVGLKRERAQPNLDLAIARVRPAIRMQSSATSSMQRNAAMHNF